MLLPAWIDINFIHKSTHFYEENKEIIICKQIFTVFSIKEEIEPSAFKKLPLYE
jgi:hypothetical protein